jgi:putative hydrolases of HD superfamily
METERLKKILEVFLTLQVTKELPRQGFFYSGFKRNDADSVAAHSFNVGIFSYLLARELKESGLEIDPDRVLKIAVMHDTGESITGDVGTWVKTLAGGVFEEVEDKAVALLFRNLSDREELIAYYQEYKELKTIESQVVKFADVLDALAQGINTPGAHLNDFKANIERHVKNKIKDEQLVTLLEKSVELMFKREVTYFRGHMEPKNETLLSKDWAE